MSKRKLYFILTRENDGHWTPSDRQFTLAEANRKIQFNRIIGGIRSRTFPVDEYLKLHPPSQDEQAGQ